MSYILIGPKGEETGPFEVAELCKWAQNGQLPPVAPIKNPETGEVTKAIDHPDLQHAFPPGSANPAKPTGSSILPTDNPKALAAYYTGVGSLACWFAGPVALILGLKALNLCKENSELHGKGHAITGIILGSLSSLVLVSVIILVIVGAIAGQP